MDEPSHPRTMDDVRQDIDRIDAQLIELLNNRAGLAIEIGKLKGHDGKPFYTPERERSIYSRIADLNPGPLRDDQLVSVFREVISAARAAERKLQVAFWGPAGTFSHQAAIETFGRSVTLKPVESISDVFLTVEHGHADYGIVPVENSTAGVVPETLDMFPQTNVKIVAETFIPIHHHLASKASSLQEVERVYAGPQPAGQCRRWLKANLPHAQVIETVPTSRAAERAVEDEKGAAIANALGIEMLGLPTLADHIEDNPHNRTRFVVLGYNEPARTGKDKTAIMFSLRNRPGELYTALGAFVSHSVNLLMIESRPAQRASFEYIFYVDCGGHVTDTNVKLAVKELKKHALETTVLGSFPSVDVNVEAGSPPLSDPD